MARKLPLAAVVAMLSLAVACGSDDVVVLEDQPVEELYNAGMDQLADGDYEAASLSFEEVERQHPFSVWAPRAQLMSGYAYFRADRYDDAVIALDRFIQLHPSHKDAAYAYYLRAITYYEQIVDVVRDQTTTREALAALDDVITRYPDSDYARDAKLKRDLTVDHLAGQEMMVGRYYQREGSLVAAMNRFTYVLVNYQTTSQAPEALHRLVESNLVLGMDEEARKYAAVLGYNFPSSRWYADSYELLTGERVAVGVDVDDSDFIDRSLDYLFEPNYRIGYVDPDADILGTGIEAETLGQAAGGVVTRAAVLGEDGETQPLDLAGQVASTVAELPPPATALNDEGTREEIDGLLASARAQQAAAEAAARGWRDYAAEQEADLAAKARGESQAAIASAAADYWAAREDLLVIAYQQLNGELTDAGARSAAESRVAETGLAYWQTVARHGLTDSDREQAAQNAADAEQALRFWRSSGRSWLDRTLGSAT